MALTCYSLHKDMLKMHDSCYIYAKYFLRFQNKFDLLLLSFGAALWFWDGAVPLIDLDWVGLIQDGQVQVGSSLKSDNDWWDTTMEYTQVIKTNTVSAFNFAGLMINYSHLAAQKHILRSLSSRWADGCSLIIFVLHTVYNIIQW